MKDYREHPGINWSKLKWMMESPRDYLVRKDFEEPPTDSMKMGSFIDCGLLTPDLLDSTYVVVPPIKWGNNADKAETVRAYQKASGAPDIVVASVLKMKKDEATKVLYELVNKTGKEPIPSTGSDTDIYNYEKGMRIIESNQNRPAFMALMEEVEDIQKPLYATCEVTGLQLKGLLDVVTSKTITDLKTTISLSKRFSSIADRKYTNQLAYYDYLARLNGINKPGHWLVFISTVAPYKMKFVEIDPREIQARHEENIQLLSQLRSCLESQVFPDGSETPDFYEYRKASQYESPELQWLEREQQPGAGSL